MAAHSEDFVILACVCLPQYHSVTDEQTDGRTDGRTPRRWLRRAKHSAVARKKYYINTIAFNLVVSRSAYLSPNLCHVNNTNTQEYCAYNN